MAERVKKERWWIGAILVLAFILRWWGSGFGLPHLYHADEPIVVNQALAYGAGTLKPVYLKIPQFVSLMVFACFGAYFLVLKAFGIIKNPEAFGQLFLSDPTSFYLLARIVFGVLPGVLCIYLVYRLGKRLISPKHGLVAAFLLATAFLHVRDSHYIYMDIPLLCLFVGSFFPIDGVLTQGRKKDYVHFGILSGLAVAAKYNGVFIGAPFLIAHGMRFFRDRGKKLHFYFLLAGGIALAAFAVVNPASWIYARDFVSDTRKISEFEGFIGWSHHLSYSLAGGVGIPFLLVAGLGMALSLQRGQERLLPMLGFVLIYYFVLCVMSQPYERYVLPLIPFLSFFAATGLLLLSGSGARRNIFLVFFLTACVLPSLVKTVLCDKILVRKDVRTLALEWAETHLPAESKVALDVPFFMPRLKPTVAQLVEKENQVLPTGRKADLKRIRWLKEEALRGGGPRYELYFLSSDSADGFLFSRPRIPYRYEELQARGIRYVLFAKVRKDHEPLFYQTLCQKAQRVARFSPYKEAAREWPLSGITLTGASFLWKELAARERNGQIIEIFKLIG